MAKYAQTICRQIADKLFDCGRPCSETGAQRVKLVLCIIPHQILLQNRKLYVIGKIKTGEC